MPVKKPAVRATAKRKPAVAAKPNVVGKKTVPQTTPVSPVSHPNEVAQLILNATTGRTR